MSKTKSEEPEPIVLSVSLIESGRFIRAGEPTPYLRVEDVPAHLKEIHRHRGGSAGVESKRERLL